MSRVINRDDVVDLTEQYKFDPIDAYQTNREVKEAHDKGWHEGVGHSVAYFRDLPFLHRLYIAFTGELFG